jgi:16S rRNA (guanine966-N2)-methyltransferase
MPSNSIRILAGSAKNRALKVPDSARPTPVRVRQSLFDILQVFAPGATLLDLYAGAGAVAFEAVSRGFSATLVELNPKAIATLQENQRNLQLPAKIIRADAKKFIQESNLGFDMVFIDPPYSQDIAAVAYLALSYPQLVNPDGVLIVQSPVQIELTAPAPAFVQERRVYGSNALTLYWKE